MKVLKPVNRKDVVVNKIYCNCCGEEIPKDRFGYLEDYVHIHKSWGYNSNRDGENHSFDICQRCYDKWIKKMKISVDVADKVDNLRHV